ncbi:MAG TPA: asparagine synthase-related protein, partial [Gemmatimonadaceae bacterium]|nr:asparagine synthase-related protein [Gemmatimonadaceae bacterium]
MELVLRYLIRSGPWTPDRVARLLGDFAFVLWDASSGELLAARDVLGVRPLYHALRAPGLATFGSHAELLATGDDYDMEYLAARVSERSHEDELTVYRGVRALAGASVLHLHRSWRDQPRVTTYWSATEVQHTALPPRTERDKVDAFRTLLIDAVRARLGDGAWCWSHLSGGLDSSSVVSIAQWLARRAELPRGLAGTVSFVDPFGIGADEREYSDAVVALHGVRNETVPHQVSWSDVLRAPPEFDQPNRSFPTGVRDARAAALIRQAGGDVLLT